MLQLFNREEKSKAEFDHINREHMVAYKTAIIAYGWFYPVDRVPLHAGAGAAARLGWIAGAAGRADHRRRGGILAVRDCDSFARFRISAKSTTFCKRPWRLPSASSSCSTRGRDGRRRWLRSRLPTAREEIEFDHVWFAYKDEDWVLRDVSFRSSPARNHRRRRPHRRRQDHPDESAAPFLRRAEGRHSHRRSRYPRARPRELRRHFGVVLQDPYLFTGTIEDNIRLGTDGITEERLAAAAEQVNLMAFMRFFPKDSRQPSASAGLGFSTGQKQLISLPARWPTIRGF